MTNVSTWHHSPDPNRGRRRPRVYEVRVTYTREQGDLESAARRLGYGADMSGFFIRAAHVWMWLMSEAAFRDDTAEERKQQERLDQESSEREERKRRARWDRQSRRHEEREQEMHRREEELRRRELALLEREGRP